MAEGHTECWKCRYKLEEEEAEKPKPKKFNVDEHFNNELHAIMKYLFPDLDKVKKTKKTAKKRKRVENDQETNVSS